MNVREVYFDEIPDIVAKGKAFEEASRNVKVDVEHTTRTFQNMVKNGTAVMLALFDDEGKRLGGLAYIKSPDLYSGELMAIELYWFVHPGNRGSGKLLLDAFEESAKKNGCVKAAMIHMVDSFPETLKTLYEKRGYKLIELHYTKEL